MAPPLTLNASNKSGSAGQQVLRLEISSDNTNALLYVKTANAGRAGLTVWDETHAQLGNISVYGATIGGSIVIPNSAVGSLFGRNAANSADVPLFGLDSGDNLNIGRSDAVGVIQMFGPTYFFDDAASPTLFFNISPTILVMKNDLYLAGKDTLGADVRLIGVSAADVVYVGSIDAMNGTGDVYFRTDGADRVYLTASSLAPTAAGAVSLGTTALPWGPTWVTNPSGTAFVYSRSTTVYPLGVKGRVYSEQDTSGSAAGFAWRATGGALNAKMWDMLGQTDNTLVGRALADDEASSSTWLTVTRSGTTVTLITLSAQAVQVNAILRVGEGVWHESTANVRLINSTASATYFGLTSTGGGYYWRNASDVDIMSLLNTGALVLATAASKIVPGATSLSLRNNADSADNLIILDGGNATFRANVSVGGQMYAPTNAIGNSSTAFTADWNNSNVQSVTNTGAATVTFSNPNSGGVYTLIITAGTGAAQWTWPAAVKWAGGTAPTLTTTSGKIDVITFLYDGTSYIGVVSGQNY